MRRTTFVSLIIVTLIGILAFSTIAFAYNEAPMLSEKVKAGKLPPVDERLPKNPMVIKPFKEVGKYGGTWHRYTNNQDFAYIRMVMYGFSFIRWVDDGLGLEPGLVDSWESNEDKTVWTFHFREGLKWSDGHPFTVDDVLFWWEDMVLNEEHSDVPPDWAIAGGELVKMEKLDDYTLRFKYTVPAPLLPERLAMWPNAGIGPRNVAPKHYLKQFHPKYNPEYTDFEVFEEKQEWWTNPDCPVLSEWMPVEYKAADKLVLERNPYYYGVDTEGNQLPYIDRIEVQFVEDLEVVKLKVINGQTEMQLRPYIPLTDLALLKQNARQGNYKVFLWDSGSGSGPIFYPNWNHPDPDKLKLYRNQKFRAALSHAIDRKRIQKMIFFGLGELTTATFSPKAIEYHRSEEGKKIYKEWRDAYVAYDPEKAKKLLDEIGVVDKDGDGWRDMPNGKELTLRIDADAEASKEYVQTNEMVKANWEAIGLKTIINPVDGSNLTVMNQTATFDIRDSWELGDGPNHLVYPQWLVPIGPDRWAPLYGRWYSVQGTPAATEELDKAPRDRTPPREKPVPSGPVDRLQKIYDKAKIEPDTQKRDQLVFDMIRIHIEEGPFLIGTVADYPRPVVVSNRMRNVPDGKELPLGGFVNPWIVVYPAITMPAQYWLAD